MKKLHRNSRGGLRRTRISLSQVSWQSGQHQNRKIKWDGHLCNWRQGTVPNLRAVKAYEEREWEASGIPDSELEGGEWSTSCRDNAPWNPVGMRSAGLKSRSEHAHDGYLYSHTLHPAIAARPGFQREIWNLDSRIISRKTNTLGYCLD